MGIQRKPITVLLSIVLGLTACGEAVQANTSQPAGIYEIWYGSSPTNLPYVQGGQVVVQWRDLHVDEDEYDWTLLDNRLAGLTYPVTVQINGNRKPDYLFTRVPSKANWGESQVQDPGGILMYWHPDYIGEYSKFLEALGDHLYASPYRDNILGIRQNYNAIGTEILNVPAEHRDAGAWTVPAGAANGPNWTGALLYNYQKVILDGFIAAFIEGRTNPVLLFVRNNVPDVVLQAQANGKPAGYTYADYFHDGVASIFHTSSDPEPRTAAIANRFDFFHTYVRTGETKGYAESFSTAWGEHGGQTTLSWAPPVQKNYWRLLSDLNMGVSYIAIYSPDLQVALNGTYKGANVGLDYQAEFDEAFQFAAKYAGYHADPAESPGAWIAFRSSALDLAPSDYNVRVQDYGMHMYLQNPEDTAGLDAREDGDAVPVVANRTAAGQQSIGPYSQRYGAWARMVMPNEPARLSLDADFVDSLNSSNAANIYVTYLDTSPTVRSFTISFGAQSVQIDLNDTGEWVTEEIAVTSELIADSNGSHLQLGTSGGGVIFHMIEVVK